MSWKINDHKKFETEYEVKEAARNGQRCRIVELVPGDEPYSVDDYLVEFDDGHRYVAYVSEIQETWREAA